MTKDTKRSWESGGRVIDKDRQLHKRCLEAGIKGCKELIATLGPSQELSKRIMEYSRRLFELVRYEKSLPVKIEDTPQEVLKNKIK